MKYILIFLLMIISCVVAPKYLIEVKDHKWIDSLENHNVTITNIDTIYTINDSRSFIVEYKSNLK